MKIEECVRDPGIGTALALAISLALVASQVAAQGQARGQDELEEIVVTAQKRDQALEDVPISISLFSGAALEDAGVKSVNDMGSIVPGMRIDTQGAASQPTIRGVGTSTAGTGFTSNVAVYVDGFYVPNQYDTDLPLLNLTSVQVLKGPQGTLFGRNATGGAILLETKAPSFDPKFEAQLTAADHSKLGASIYGSTGLTDTIAVDFAGAYEQGDGYLKNIATGSNLDGEYDKQSYRASLLYKDGAGLEGELAYSHAETDDPSGSAFGAWNGHSLGTLYGPAFGITPIVAVAPHKVSNTAPTAYTTETDGVFLTVTKDFGNLMLKSLTMYRDSQSHTEIDLDSSNIPVFAVEFSPQSDALSQELNLSGASDKLDWLVGAFYMQYEEEFHRLAATESPLVVYDLNRTDIKSAAIFADVTYQVVDNLFLTAGLRYSTEEASSIVRGHVAVGDIPEWSEDWSDTSARLVARYRLANEASVYASYAQGFKAGMLQPSAPSLEPIDPEGIDAFEVGYKIDRGSMFFNAAAFYYDYTDMQVASFNGLQALVVNAASSTIYGADLQFSALVADGLTVGIGAAYTRGEYDEFPGSQARNLDPMTPGYLQIVDSDANGNPMMRTPEWTANLAVAYETGLAGGTLHLSADGYVTSDFYFDPNKQFKQGSYNLLNVRAAWKAPGDHFTVALYGANVTDESYLSSVLPGDFAIQQGFGDPATYGITIGYKY